MKKRVISMVLALLMVLTLVPAMSEEGYADGNGTLIKTITVTGIPEPVEGQVCSTQGLTIPGNANYALSTGSNGTGWYFDPYNKGSYSYWFTNGTFEAGQTYQVTVDLTAKDGYYFDAAQTTATINGKTAKIQLIYSGNTRCYVKLQYTLEGEEYTVSFNGNGGSGAMASLPIMENTKYALPQCDFTAPAEQEFLCWQVNGENYMPGDRIPINSDTVVKAIWTKIETFSVTYDTMGHGSAVPTQSGITRNGYATKPEDPKAEGYRFDGWYQDSGLTQKFNFSDTCITGNITLYAKWLTLIKTITVTGIPKPVAGQVCSTRGLTIPENANYALSTGSNGTGWYFDPYNKGSYSYWFTNGIFEAGETYQVTVDLTAKDGYYFDAAQTTATINGNTAKIQLIYNGNTRCYVKVQYVAQCDNPDYIWYRSESGHYQKCSICGMVMFEGEHNYDEDGYCVDCDYYRDCYCDNMEYTWDQNGHWWECTQHDWTECPNHGILDYAEHEATRLEDIKGQYGVNEDTYCREHTKTGFTDVLYDCQNGYYCNICGASYGEGKHYMVRSSKLSTPATITDPGKDVYVCYYDGDVNGHNMEIHCSETYTVTTAALGDLNGNGKVDDADLTMLLRHVAKIEMITDTDLLRQADFDLSGTVDAADVTMLAMAPTLLH